MSSSSEQGFLSSAATVRQESMLEGRKVEGAIPFEYGWSSGELHLNPACDVFIERCLTLLFFSFQPPSKVQEAVVFCIQGGEKL